MKPEVLIILISGIVSFFMFLYFVPVNLWITAIFSGVKIELMELVFMRIRKSPMKDIVDSLIHCTKAGVKITATELETHALAGGDVKAFTRALIKARLENIEVTYQELAAQNLAGNDLMEFLNKAKSMNRSKIQDLRLSITTKS